MADPIVGPKAAAAPVAPVLGTPEYDAAMVAKVDALNPPAPVVAPAVPATKPDGVPDKFWNVEKAAVDYAAWAKSTSELEAKFTQTQQKPVVTPAVVPVVDTVKATLEAAVAAVKANPEAKVTELVAAEKALADHKSPVAAPVVDPAAALQAKGLDINDFNAEYADKGALSEESYAKLAKVGFDKATVDSVVAGQVALRAQADAEGYAVAGGQEAFTKMSAWAAANLTAPQKEAFNTAVSGSTDAMKLAVAGLRAQYEAASGREPTLVGGAAPGATNTGYQSRAEMTAAMRDPRYQKDAAYRKSVETKVANAAF